MKKELSINDENYSYYVQKIGARALRKNDKVVLTLDEEGILRSWEFVPFVYAESLQAEEHLPPIRTFCPVRIKPKMYTEKEMFKISTMYDKGHSSTSIAKTLGIDLINLRNYLSRFTKTELTHSEKLDIKEVFDTSTRNAEQIAIMLKIRLNLVKNERMRIIEAYAIELGIKLVHIPKILLGIGRNNSSKNIAEHAGVELSIIEAFLKKIN